MNLKTGLKSYFDRSSSLLYSFLLVLPIFLLYELLISIGQPGDAQIRISVDIWMKSLLQLTGFNVVHATFILVAIVGVIVVFVERKRLKTIESSTFLWMHVESIVYALLMASMVGYVISGLFDLSAFQSDSNSVVQSLSFLDQFALSLGAGLYEELFFRVILVGLLYFLLKAFIAKEWLAAAFAAIIGALIFSGVHYIGDMGDVFTWRSFSFRALAGLTLNALYVWRGFGIAAATHAWYDLWVLLII